MRVQAGCSGFAFLISWSLYLLQLSTVCYAEKNCKLDKPIPRICGDNETCVQTNGTDGVCKCLISYYLVGDKCVLIPVPLDPTSSSISDDHSVSSGSSLALWIVIPCLILVLTGVALVLAKRLKLVEKLYQFRVRRYNTVFVTSLQDDDAPIS